MPTSRPPGAAASPPAGGEGPGTPDAPGATADPGTASAGTNAGTGTGAQRRDAGGGSRTIVVAIDGPSGSGKSTVAKRVAGRLGLRYLDTGAMYRAVTWAVLEARVDLDDAVAVAELAERTLVTVGTSPRRPTIAVNGTDVSRPIRGRAVTNAVSAVSAVPAVRKQLVAQQRSIIDGGGIVVEGRDIGTTVAPDAAVKIFLTASADARARRRNRQLSAVGEGAGVELTRDEIERRDHKDSSRSASPLTKASDAVEIDSTSMPVDDVVAAVLARCAAADGNEQRPPRRRGRAGADAGADRASTRAQSRRTGPGRSHLHQAPHGVPGVAVGREALA